MTMNRWVALTVLAAVAIVAVAGYAIGAGKPSKDLVLCATKKSGDLSLASAKGKCAKGEKKLTVAKEGPVGPVGPAGSPGVNAVVTAEPVHYVTGPATDQCKANPGTFCKPSGLSYEWLNEGDYNATNRELVGYFKDSAGYVHLVGVALFRTGGGGTGGGFEPDGPFYLPPGYRPARAEAFGAAAATGFNPTAFTGGGFVEIRPDGTVATEAQLVGLGGIVFKAAQ
jgi:hypothetical protein